MLEAETLAHGASGNAAGICGPPRDRRAGGSTSQQQAAAWFEMRRATWALHRVLAETLPTQAGGVGYGWNPTPGVGVAVTREEEEQARRELAVMQELGIPGASWLTPAEMRARFPALDGAGIRGGVLSADLEHGGAQVEPGLFTTALMRAAERLTYGRTQVREGCKAVGLLFEGHRGDSSG